MNSTPPSTPTPSADNSRFLIAEDDGPVARGLKRVLEQWRPAEIAETPAAAAELAARENFCGFVLDLRFGDTRDAGLALLASLRERFPRTPAIVVTGELERELINRALRLDALYACKPVGEAELRPFIYRAMLSGVSGDERVAQAVQAIIEQYQLPPNESDLLVHALAGASRAEIAKRRKLSENTLKLHIRSLLGKLDAQNLDEVRAMLYRDALGLK